jgi:hypothetical protein
MSGIKQAPVSVLLLLSAISLYADAADQTQAATPDVLVCKDGEKLLGTVISATDTAVVFKSDAAGQVKIEWSKIQELRSSNKFALLRKDTKLRSAQDANSVPQGTLLATDQQVQVSPGAQVPPQSLAVANVGNVVNQAAFQQAFERLGFLEAWKGGATVGIAYTNSTQKSQSYTAAINLTRAVPGETWADQRSGTTFSFNEAYGEISQPGTPTTKTSILHLGVEQDWYLNPRLFVFVQGLFDHNYSQGLDLQQDYGGGLGFVVVKTARQEFDVKASVDYIKQQFAISSQNKDLIGSTFGERYTYKFPRGIVFTELGNYIPAWNDTSAYSAIFNANLTFPVYHHFGFTLGGIDSYLNNPPIGFKKNSFTLTMGLTYSLQ